MALDLNFLLAREQLSLLRARFASAGEARDRHFATAAEHASDVRQTRYPHRRLGLALIAGLRAAL
jgi:hypothetical protein